MVPFWKARPCPGCAAPLVVILCNGTDYRGNKAQVQVELAKLLDCSLKTVGSRIVSRSAWSDRL